MAKPATKKIVAPVRKTTFELVDVPQGSPEWFEARLGIPTASRFSDILAQGDGKSRETYLRELAGEKLTGIPAENFTSKAMERGIEHERTAFDEYAKPRFDVTRVGFVRNAGLMRYATVGASPDALVGDDGGLECKSMKPELLIDVLERGTFPAKFRAQVQGCMWVCERRWWTLKIFYPGMPKCEFTVERDGAYIAELQRAVEVFAWDVQQLVKKMKAMGGGNGDD